MLETAKQRATWWISFRCLYDGIPAAQTSAAAHHSAHPPPHYQAPPEDQSLSAAPTPSSIHHLRSP